MQKFFVCWLVSIIYFFRQSFCEIVYTYQTILELPGEACPNFFFFDNQLNYIQVCIPDPSKEPDWPEKSYFRLVYNNMPASHSLINEVYVQSSNFQSINYDESLGNALLIMTPEGVYLTSSTYSLEEDGFLTLSVNEVLEHFKTPSIVSNFPGKLMILNNARKTHEFQKSFLSTPNDLVIENPDIDRFYPFLDRFLNISYFPLNNPFLNAVKNDNYSNFIIILNEHEPTFFDGLLKEGYQGTQRIIIKQTLSKIFENKSNASKSFFQTILSLHFQYALSKNFNSEHLTVFNSYLEKALTPEFSEVLLNNTKIVGTDFYTEFREFVNITTIFIYTERCIFIFRINVDFSYISYQGNICFLEQLKMRISDFTLNTMQNSLQIKHYSENTSQIYITKLDYTLFYQTNFNCCICKIVQEDKFCDPDLFKNNCKHDCNRIIVASQNNVNSNSLWIGCVVSVVLFIPFTVLIIYLVQRFCLRSRNYNAVNTVREARKFMNFQIFSAVANKIEISNIDSEGLKKLEEHCCICLELLSARDCAYFICKLHMSHLDCMYNYEREKFIENKQELCPFRCERMVK